jgi:hypothetical protein
MIESYSTMPQNPIRFSGNMIYAYGTTIRQTPDDVLIAYADALKEAGLNRIDFNPSISSLTDPAALAKYDILIAHIREIGLQIAVNPEYELPDDAALKTLEAYRKAAVAGEAAFAARYKPDYLVVVHEPTTADERRTHSYSELSTPAQWGDFVTATATAVKAASKTTLVGAGAFVDASGREIPYFNEFVTIPDLDYVTLDNYDAEPAAITNLDLMVQTAHGAAKPVYMEETWRPAYLPNGLPPAGVPLEKASPLGTGNAVFEPLDEIWLKAMALYCATHGLDAVTAFSTPPFFLYVTSGPDSYFDAAYVREDEQALLQGKRAGTFQAYQDLAQQLGQDASSGNWDGRPSW